MSQDCSKLHVVAFGVALGVTWSFGIFLLGILAFFFDWGRLFIGAMGSVYVGYEPSVIGSLIGGVLAFIDAFIAGVIIAWIYNRCMTRCKKS